MKESRPATKPCYFLVLGYSTGWTPRFGAYLDAIVDAWRWLEPEFLVLCGGRTGGLHPETSEAQWLAWLLEDLGIPGPRMRLEEASTTTVGNFVCARRQGLLPTDRPAVVCCDSYRVAKVRELSRHFHLEVREWVLRPIGNPRWGQVVRLKSHLDAMRFRLVGLPRTAKSLQTVGRPWDRP